MYCHKGRQSCNPSRISFLFSKQWCGNYCNNRIFFFFFPFTKPPVRERKAHPWRFSERGKKKLHKTVFAEKKREKNVPGYKKEKFFCKIGFCLVTLKIYIEHNAHQSQPKRNDTTPIKHTGHAKKKGGVGREGEKASSVGRRT